ncbi:MAG: SLC13 family permease [Nitrososphaerota archaeon]
MIIEWKRIKPGVFVAISISVFIISIFLGIPFKQSLSIWVFSSIIMGALFYWRFRLAFTFLGIGILLGSGLLDVPHLIEFAGLDIIIFLIGMMIIIGFLEEKHFFEAILDRVMKYGKDSAKRTLFLIMFMAALSAALVDEVTSILFMTALVIHLSARLKVSPIPLIIMTVFATNIGSSATVVGNPVGVIVALRSGYGFSDFLRWAAPISITCLVLSYFLSIYYFKDYIKEIDEQLKVVRKELAVQLVVKDPAANKKDMIVASIIFAGTLVGLIFHTFIESMLGLDKNTMLIGVPLISAGIVILLERVRARELVEKRVDWWTLSFFLMFFATVGTLTYTGATSLIANTIITSTGTEIFPLMFSTGWIAGLMSALMDNVLAVTLWSSIVTQLSQLGVNVAPLWWVLLFAGTLMGNLTIIGSTANIVAAGLVERQKIGHMTLKEWIKPGAIVSIPTFLISLLMIYLQVPLMIT